MEITIGVGGYKGTFRQQTHLQREMYLRDVFSGAEGTLQLGCVAEVSPEWCGYEVKEETQNHTELSLCCHLKPQHELLQQQRRFARVGFACQSYRHFGESLSITERTFR